MLLSIKYEMIKSLKVKLVFDDESVKTRTIELNDLAIVTFNKDGRRCTVEGVVTKIEDACSAKCDCWYIIVDGSSNNISRIERIKVKNILDLEITKKANQTSTISTPLDSSRIVSLRIAGGLLQATQDGRTWVSLLKIPEKESDIIVEDPDDQDLAAKIARLIPKRIPVERRVEMIQNLVDLYNEELANDIEDLTSSLIPDEPTDTPTDTTTPDDSTTTTPGDDTVVDDPTTTDPDNTTDSGVVDGGEEDDGTDDEII